LTEQSLAGRRFGAYEVLEELGSGGMGKVYRAKNVTLERIVALKTLAPQFSADQEFVQRFLTEARAAARLNHPNIVQIYDFGCVDGTYYLAMEYVDGQSLRALLKRYRFRESEAILLIRHVVAALAVAHAEGIVHRDIKPDNLMLTTRLDKLKIVDLGIAKHMGEEQSLTQTGQAVGTPAYISPEQIRGVKDIDARADIYSLGATFFQLLTRHVPYKGTGALVMSMHLTQPLPDPRMYEPGLSEGVCRVLRKMMAKEREERYSNVYELDRDLYRLQIGEVPEPDEPAASGIATLVSSDREGSLPRTPAPSASPGGLSSAFPHPEAPPGTPPPSTPPPMPTAAPTFREEDLHFVEVELAKHIGPLARVLVKRAAKSVASLVALGAALADNIPDEEGRRAFRAVVRARAK